MMCAMPTTTKPPEYPWRTGEYGKILRDHDDQTWAEWRKVYWEAVLYDGPGPLHGLTIGKADVLQWFHGMPVRVMTLNDKDRRHGATFGIFKTINLPGDWTQGFECVGDVVVGTAFPDEKMFADERVGAGSSRIMSPAAILEFEFIGPEPWVSCWNCGVFRPKHRLRHEWRWTEVWTPEDFGCMDTYEWVCRNVDEDGYCR